MSTTALEAIQCAQINFNNVANLNPSLENHPMWKIAMDQLGNGIDAMENGNDPDHVIQESMGSEVNTD